MLAQTWMDVKPFVTNASTSPKLPAFVPRTRDYGAAGAAFSRQAVGKLYGRSFLPFPLHSRIPSNACTLLVVDR
jgi:hypothetical protein